MEIEIEIKDAPAFIAGLIREGLEFQAVQIDRVIRIIITGH